MYRFVLPLILSYSLFPPMLAAETPQIPAAMAQRANELMLSAQDANDGYAIVESLTTEVGPRLAGTVAEKRARAWAVDTLKRSGFSNVRVEEFDLPLWTRGLERAEIVSPFPQPLTITTLGGSASTGPEGVEGEVVSVTSLAELRAANSDKVGGRIVFVDEPMTRTQDGHGYFFASAKRREAAYVAQRLGAKAVLIRSVGTSSHRFAHTGQMRRVNDKGDGLPGVPAAALSAPDADQLQRVLSRGEAVKLRLILTPQTEPAGTSGNVIAEIPGREIPEEIVLVGAHLDSWDLGTGAVDDGAGVGIIIAAAKLLREALPEGPRRTVRIVLFGAEEVGLVGAKAYAEQHADELQQHVVATESDFGAGQIWRFDTGVPDQHRELGLAMAGVLRPLGIGPGKDTASGGPDMRFIRLAGVPVVGLIQNGWDFFDLHHTPNDTLDKINPEDLTQNVAAYAAFLYLAAELEQDFRD